MQSHSKMVFEANTKLDIIKKIKIWTSSAVRKYSLPVSLELMAPCKVL